MSEKLSISQWAKNLSQIKSKKEKLQEIDLNLSKNSKKVLETRYLVRDEEGEIAETPKECFYRVAHHIALAEKKYGNNKEVVNMVKNAFLEILTNLEFLPNSPTFSGAGTDLGQLSACFVLPIEDNMKSIMKTLTDTVMIHKSGGGTGFSFSRLRPDGSRISTTNGTTSGPISFIKMYDGTTEQVKQGGTRRGANMGILRVDHPDIMAFIDAKKEEDKINNFNLSVAVTNKFMEAVKKGEKYELYDPHKKKVVDKIDAQKVFDKIANNAWKTGEPGLFFIDRANEDNPTPKISAIESTNPCLTEDAWVTTKKGVKQISDLINKKSQLLANGSFYSSSPKGFFKTGYKQVYEIKTNHGLALKATGDHPLLKISKQTSDKQETTWTQVGDISDGDKISLSNNRGANWQGRGTHSQGYLLGLLIGDGRLSKDNAVISVWDNQGDKNEEMMDYVLESVSDMSQRSDFNGFSKIKTKPEYRLKLSALTKLVHQYGLRADNKTITKQAEKTSSQFHEGLLMGLFDADGTVIGNQEKGVSVRLWQHDLKLLKAAQRMLLRLGIVSKIYKDRKPAGKKMMPDQKGGSKLYQVSAGHELVIANDNLIEFDKRIGFLEKRKKAKLSELIKKYKRRPNRERFSTEVKKIKKIGKKPVYDVKVDKVHAFSANGIYVHNCGEEPLMPYESCNLGSINLAKFVKQKTGKSKIDWDRLKYVTRLAVRFLDNVIDVNQYPIDEINEMTKKTRKIGLGVMGWANLLYGLNLRYDSQEARDLGKKVMKFIKNNSIEASKTLAEKRGVFPAYEGSIWDKKDIKMRNAATNTVAPTGTLSFIANTSPGIEPNFAIAYTRNVLDGQKLVDANPIFKQVAKERGFYSKKLMEKIAQGAELSKLKEVPDDIKKIFITSHNIGPEDHLKMQATFQKYVDAGISKTINFSNSATVDDVKKSYLLAYDLKVKGVTIYRDGSRDKQVMEKGKKKKKEKPKEKKIEGGQIKPRKRPKSLLGCTYKTKTSYGNLYITINEDKNGMPFEVFANIGKAGGFFAAKAEAISRLISLALRSGVPVKEVINQLKSIRGPSPSFGDQGKIFSLPDAIAQTLQRYIKEKEDGRQLGLKLDEEKEAKRLEPNTKNEEMSVADIGEAPICPDCGRMLTFSEGCMSCPNCGYSKCS